MEIRISLTADELVSLATEKLNKQGIVVPGSFESLVTTDIISVTSHEGTFKGTQKAVEVVFTG